MILTNTVIQVVSAKIAYFERAAYYAVRRFSCNQAGRAMKNPVNVLIYLHAPATITPVGAPRRRDRDSYRDIAVNPGSPLAPSSCTLARNGSSANEN